MKELLNELLSTILEARVVRKVGDVWKTASGTWSAKSSDRVEGGFETDKKARAWLARQKGAKKSDTPKIGSMAKTDKPTVGLSAQNIGVQTAPKKSARTAKKQTAVTPSEPEYTPPEGEKVAPAGKPNQNAKPIIKTKELDQSTDSKQTFNNDSRFAGDGVPDEQFKANPEVEASTNQLTVDNIKDFFVDENGNTLFPAKYVKVLSRLLSTKPTSLTITDFTDASGAGTLASTTGELLTLMGMSIRDDAKADAFFKMVETHVKKNAKLKESIIDAAWVKSARNVRKVLNRRYDSMYGKGNWELSGSAWDIEGEVEALGLPRYKDNKGFSTDIYLQVTVGGKKVLDEISLKKDLKANLLNATSGRVPDIMVYGAATDEDKVIYEDLNARIAALAGNTKSAAKKERDELVALRNAIIEKYNADVPDDVKVDKVVARQKQLYDDYVASNVNEIKDFATTWKTLDKSEKTRVIKEIVANMNQKDSYGAEVAINLDKLSRANFSSPQEFAEAVKNVIGTNDTSRKQKFMLSMMYAIQKTSTSETKAGKCINDVVENSHRHSKAVRNFLLSDQRARKGLLLSIRDAFPLKALFEGEETMALGDVVVDRKVLTNMFSTEDFSQVEQKLTVRDEPPPPSIVYRAVGKEDIPIAEITSRPDGIGYGGAWKLEMSVHKDFADLLKQQNNTTYPA